MQLENKIFNDWKYNLLIVLLIELAIIAVYLYNPIFTIIFVIPIIAAVFFYFGILKNPAFFIGLMIFGTGLDQLGRVFGPITVYHIGWSLLLLSTLMYILFNDDIKFTISTPINKYVYAYLGISSFTLIYTYNFVSGLMQILITAALFFSFLIGVVFVNKKSHFVAIIISMILANIFNSGLIIYQMVFQNVKYFGRHAVESSTGEKVWRVSGAFDDPNVGAAFISIGVIYFLAIIIYSNYNKLIKVSLVPVILLSVIGIGLTFSRTIWMSLIISLLFLLWLNKNKKYLIGFSSILFLGILGVILFTSLGTFVLERFSSIFDIMKDISTRSRVAMAISGFEMFLDNPLLGKGIRSFPILYDFYLDPLIPPQLLYVKESHTMIIVLLAELGIFGLAIVFFWFKRVFHDAIKSYQSIDDPFLKSIAAGNLTVFFSLNIDFLFYGNLFPEFNLIWINLALIYALKKNFIEAKL